MTLLRRFLPLLAALTVLLCAGAAFAHGVAGKDATFIENVQGAAVGPFLYLGAKHMITGYDHLLFLFGVIFFLYRLKDVALYVSLFTLGHSITLLAGVLSGIHANAFIVDAIIGFSVVYKAFENMGGFKRLLGLQPDTRIAVLVFGLFHGFGLATKLQELQLSPNGLFTNMISFNVGVEIGQVMALTVLLLVLGFWRMRPSFFRNAFAANTIIMACGWLLVCYQVTGYLISA